MEVEYTYKDYRCEKGIKAFIQMIQELLSIPGWLWKRVRGFEGKVITLEKAPYMDTHSWNCSALLVEEVGQKRWHNCFFYPFWKVSPGDTVTRKFPGRLYVIREGRKIKVGGVY